MAESFYFICYSRRDGEDTSLKLADQLVAGPPSIPVWLDRRNLQPSIDWDEQILEALRGCAGVLYVMTPDSVRPNSECKREWTRGLKYNKPIIPLLFHKEAEMPFRLEPRQYADFTLGFNAALAQLREHLRWRGSPEGLLHTMKERLQDARRDLGVASAADKPRIEDEIGELKQQIDAQQAAVNNPQAAQAQTQKNIQTGLERERQPEAPIAPRLQSCFINRPPLIPPVYFQNRHVETGLVAEFLSNESLRLVTVVGRGGVGKTAMVCRLLRALENGKLPDGGELTVDGIVYLSSRSGHPVTFPGLFYDLCKLVPPDSAKYLDQLYKDPKQTVTEQMQALLAQFPSGRTVVLLDNFEDVVDVETGAIKDRALDEALRASLEAPPHGLKFVITTRIAPQQLLRLQPALQASVELDEGLKSPYAENVLKAMDASGMLHLNAPDAPLAAIREATRGFPRALEAVVGILRSDRSTDVHGLLPELQQLSSKAEDVVRDLVGEAFNRLDPLAQEVVQALAIYGTPVPAVAVDYLLQPYRVGIDSSKTLGRLMSMQFVRGDSGRFYLHQVDRDYAQGKIPVGEPEDRDADPPPFTRYALRHRAAEYFKETRKPRESWQRLEDLTPQLAEYELRVVGQDFDAAATVLVEIDFNYLSVWGHYQLLVERYEQLVGKVKDQILEWSCIDGLGSAYARTGDYENALNCARQCLELAKVQSDKPRQASTLLAIAWYSADAGDLDSAVAPTQQSLSLFQEINDKEGEGVARGNLANRLVDLGRFEEAVVEYEKALASHREARNQEALCRDTFNLSNAHTALGNFEEARRLTRDAQQQAHKTGYKLIESAATVQQGDQLLRDGRAQDAIAAYQRSCSLADEAGAIQMQMVARRNLAWGYLAAGDLARALTASEDATKYRFPAEYPSALLCRGVVMVRGGDASAAKEAFQTTIGEAERQLKGTSKAYASAYIKALALAGLVLAQDAGLAASAAQAYAEARAISAGKGTVADELRKLDTLAVADEKGVLVPVRSAATGEK